MVRRTVHIKFVLMLMESLLAIYNRNLDIEKYPFVQP